MPIRPENRGRYPKNWKEISAKIRFERGEGRCECVGECGLDHNEDGEPDGRCSAEHGKAHPRTESLVCLTAAHLPGREIEDCSDEALKGMCQQCHNKMDAPMRAAGVKKRREERQAAERAKINRKADMMAFEHECATGQRVAR